MNSTARWKSTKSVSAADFRAQIASVVSFVEMAEKPVVIERHGKPVVVLLPIPEWQELQGIREGAMPESEVG
ncbi:type II toxin-antitoxin system prevent-host-death family antitoxin [Streptomyces broussonetiae]|uniref:Antitoxin n=1 Tax=Streptomyces broussonetiae TaxID=2686304 RepID=A0A6I6N2C5_9ACTN|nr:type II toxin-antitoxin system Phd/YefM family antitoxin [Streptomyces broussonetiae]QHA04591.1 type II toxin-antitoxin system prevent-host-death family antitoxin [Streptomyces broussonetiae]